MTVRRGRGTIAAGILIACTILYAVIGLTVSRSPPAGIDAAARGVTGEFPAVAWVLTESCLWPVLTTFGITGLIVARFVPSWRMRIGASIVTTLAGWLTSNVFKDVFRRPRPAYWIVHHETTFAYSSGHAMFAVIVYWWWAVLVARSGFPPAVRIPLAALLWAWGAGVIWSRLALGAHYPTDLLGGALLGAGLLSASAFVTQRIDSRARSLEAACPRDQPG